VCLAQSGRKPSKKKKVGLDQRTNPPLGGEAGLARASLKGEEEERELYRRKEGSACTDKGRS